MNSLRHQFIRIDLSHIFGFQETDDLLYLAATIMSVCDCGFLPGMPVICFHQFSPGQHAYDGSEAKQKGFPDFIFP
jgi:hypothetical protein